MPRCVCAVFDYSKDYLKRFSGYIKRKENLPFLIYAFTGADALESFLRKERADLVLIPEDVFLNDSGSFAKELCSLSGENTQAAVLGDKRQAAGQIRYVEKYQSMEGIISDIIEILDEGGKLAAPSGASSDTLSVTGIYSFGHLDKAVNFALNLAGRGPEQKKALYINLNRFSGLNARLEEPVSAALSDVIYYFKADSEKIRAAYIRARARTGCADVLTAPDDMEDLELIGDENWEGFLSRLADISGAGRIILDIGEAFPDLTKAMDLCGCVYIICDENRDAGRISELKKYLERKGRTDLLEKIRMADPKAGK